MRLQMPLDLEVPQSAEPYRSSVNLNLATDDGMYQGNDRHYLSCGASALNVILSALQLSDAPGPATILDFGAGAGRVTRWIRAAFPIAAVDACDLRAKDMDFCARTFDVRTWISGTDIDSLQAPGIYDLIWLGSVATHLSGDKTVRMLEKMISWSRLGGLVVMSFHGRYALDRQDSGRFRYIDDESWEKIKRDYVKNGFGYADYKGQSGYGISVTKPSWTAAVVESRSALRLVSLSERAWDDHHDILAVQVNQIA
jgi:hypothetical protein